MANSPNSTPSLPKSKEQLLRDRFDALYVEWLRNRAEYADPAVELSGARDLALSDREPEVARELMTFPAVQPWMVMKKIEILEHYLGADGGTSWDYNREVVMLAGIKADLLRFPPSETA